MFESILATAQLKPVYEGAKTKGKKKATKSSGKKKSKKR